MSKFVIAKTEKGYRVHGYGASGRLNDVRYFKTKVKAENWIKDYTPSYK